MFNNSSLKYKFRTLTFGTFSAQGGSASGGLRQLLRSSFTISFNMAQFGTRRFLELYSNVKVLKLSGFGLGLLCTVIAGCTMTIPDANFVDAKTPLTIHTTQTTAQFQAYVADDEAERSQGLGEVVTFKDNQAMLFLFPAPTQPTYWMKGVSYPIDIVWVNKHQVVGIEPSVQPEQFDTPPAAFRRYVAPQQIDAVVELPEGTTSKLALASGDTITW